MSAIHEDTRAQLPPIIKREKLGDRYKIAIVKYEARDKRKKDDATGEYVTVLKANGRPKQEMVVTGLVMPGTTCRAGLGDYNQVPEPGDLVRIILGGGAFGHWIDARKTHRNGGPLHHGDIIKDSLTFAQEWTMDSGKKGPEMTSQEQVDAVYRERPRASIGIYGKLQLVEGEPEWGARCEAAASTPIPEPAGAAHGDEEPFVSLYRGHQSYRNLSTTEPWM